MVAPTSLRAIIALAITAAPAALGAPFPTVSSAFNCSRAILLDAADAYVLAQTSGKVDQLQRMLRSSWTYTENNNASADVTKGVLRKALKIDHRRTNLDLVACASYTELVSASDAANPYVIGTQIRHNTTAGSRQETLSIDTIASTTNSWLFDAKKTLQYVNQEKWTAIPEAQWDSRAAIQAAGDAYLDMWSNATAHEAVPWGTPCVRLEGSAYTGTGKADDSCKPGIPSNHNQAPNTHRRYVIDQEMGSVSVFCVWEHMMMAADSHEFRLEGGKLRYVHTMTVCGGSSVSYDCFW
ncbi:hypothetical protein B0T17DRAFT_510320 [Bombardia bombarda]|uniref:DUF8021 domain-containing protein n=1 Tax=Bombardia bombarda TaxID=252184 RepID=A0AA40BW51_9PEZI|nr:hypothetical protein B0T17DRAFT_510320 [Bombardia bombarda]